MRKIITPILVALAILVAFPVTADAQPDPSLNRYLLKNRGRARGPIRLMPYAAGNEPTVSGGGWIIYDNTNTAVSVWTGAAWVDLGGGGGAAGFDTITSGTNTVPAAMLVGNGSTLGTTGTGTLQASILTSTVPNTITLAADGIGLAIEASGAQTAHLQDWDLSGGGVASYVLSQGSSHFPQVNAGDAHEFAATIGGVTIPGYLSVSDDTTTPQLDVLIQRHTGAVAATAPILQFLKSRGTAAASTVVVTGDRIGQISAGGHDGTDYVETAAILFEAVGTIANDRVPSQIRFVTGTDAAPSVSTLAMTIDEAQKVTMAGALDVGGLEIGIAPVGAGVAGLRVTNSAENSFSAVWLGTPAAAAAGHAVMYQGASSAFLSNADHLLMYSQDASTSLGFVTSTITRMRVTPAGDVVLGAVEGGTAATTGGTLRAANVATGGADDLAAADLTLAAGLGTSAGDAGQIIFRAAPELATGDVLQTLATVITIDGGPVAGPPVVAVAGVLMLGTASTLTGPLTLANAGSAFTTTFQAGVNITASRTYTLPTDFGAAGTTLTDAAGNGTLSWVAGGGGLPVGVADALLTSDGASAAQVVELYVGTPATTAAPGAVLVGAVGGTTGAASINASTLTLQGGLPSGAGTGGSVIVATTDGVDPGGFGAQVPTTVATFDATAAAATALVGGLSLTGTQTSTNIIDVPNADSLTTGSIATLVSNSASASTRNLVHIHNNHTSATGTTPFRVTQDALQNVMVLTTAAGSDTLIYGSTGALVMSRDTASALLQLVTNSNTATEAPIFYAVRRRGTDGSRIIVQDNDTLGIFQFTGMETNGFARVAARIVAYVDGTPGSEDMPGRLTFETTPDGAMVSVPRLTVNNAGTVYLGDGQTSTTADSPTLTATGGSGPNNAAGDFTHRVGLSTGNADPGTHIFTGSAVEASSSTPQTPFTILTLDGNTGGDNAIAQFESQIAMTELSGSPADIAGAGQIWTESDNEVHFLDGDGNENRLTKHNDAKFYFNGVAVALDLTEANVDHGIDAATMEDIDGGWTFLGGSNGATGGFTITAVANDGGGEIRCTTSAAHGITAPSVAVITNTSDVVDLPNGVYYVDNVSDTTHFDLLGSTFTSTTATADYIEPSQLTSGAGDTGENAIIWDLNQEASGGGSTYITKVWKCTSAGTCAAYASGTRERTTSTNTIGSYTGAVIEAATASGDKYFMTTQAGSTTVDPTHKYGSLMIIRN